MACFLAVAKLGGRAPDRAFAVSLAALIGLFLYPAVVIVPAWLVGAVDTATGRSLARSDARGLALPVIFGALGSWLTSPALIVLCTLSRWPRGAARPASSLPS